MFVHSVVVESWGKLSSGERDAAVPGAFCGQDFALCCNCLVQVRCLVIFFRMQLHARLSQLTVAPAWPVRFVT